MSSPPDDGEESEYAALMTAADASAALLAGLPDGGAAGSCVVAETAAADGPVRWRDVVAVHVDTEDDADPDDDLAWYATQEIGDLIASTGSRHFEARDGSDTISRMDAITFPPAPVNEPNLTYAPGSPGARGAGHRAGPAGGQAAHLPRRTSAASAATAAARRSRSSSRTTTSTCWAP